MFSNFFIKFSIKNYFEKKNRHYFILFFVENVFICVAFTFVCSDFMENQVEVKFTKTTYF